MKEIYLIQDKSAFGEGEEPDHVLALAILLQQFKVKGEPIHFRIESTTGSWAVDVASLSSEDKQPEAQAGVPQRDPDNLSYEQRMFEINKYLLALDAAEDEVEEEPKEDPLRMFR